MRKLLKHEHGHVLIFTAAALMAIFSLAALAIDTGYMWTAKNQLQAAVDAAALAGAEGLLDSQSEATEQAIQFASANDVAHQNIILTTDNISFPTLNRIQVQTNHTIRLFFAPIIGVNTASFSATAAAEITKLAGTGGARPWALPNMNWPEGTEVIVKAGELGAPATGNGFFYPVAYPPINKGNPITGAQQYEENIATGADCMTAIGDELLVEPGNMVGPTRKGVEALIELDPYATWNGEEIVDSAYPGFSSPRIAKVPLFDPAYPPEGGRDSVTIVGWTSIFIKDIQGKNVMGIVMDITTTGVAGPVNSATTLYGVHLVR